ncbi:hypothetical protein [Clostridium akagii]|uniref:hypothetical protein n=1 Tax=Clostridium akagii TaxID=91623 RepID=UPI00047A6BB6|nr:hypothetical protein [Clostridium akagii]
MAKSIDEKIAQCKEIIEIENDKMKKYLEQKRKEAKELEEKNSKEVYKLLKSLGIDTTKDMEKVKNDLQVLYGSDIKEESESGNSNS